MQAPILPPPTFENVPYGPHERNALDVWLPRSPRSAGPESPDGPLPLVIYIHGGGFRQGDKRSLGLVQLEQWLGAGFAVAAINYRLSQHAPYPAQVLDSARAVQYLRKRAPEWNLDPNRFAASGGSAGGGISLWLGFRDDLADPHSDDPAARQSTRLSCMLVRNTQSSYDLRFIKQIIPGAAYRHPALIQLFDLGPGEIDAPPPEKARLFEESSPINYVTADDPPVYMTYRQENVPLPPDADEGTGIHHPTFGEVLKAKLDALGIECTVRCGVTGPGDPAEIAFLRRYLVGHR
ncbi:MAG: alpha/beta hydrolase [Chloroflexi bacterium]|nr:alpha/beta hydrolase [Chloroflexota bacterium]